MHSSAYGLEPESISTNSGKISDDKVNAFVSSKPTQFPISRGILWDREPVESPHYVRSADVIPPLYFSKGAVQSLLLDTMQQQKKGSRVANSHDRTATIIAIDSIPEEERVSLTRDPTIRSTISTSPYVMQISESTGNESAKSPNNNGCFVTIPISSRPANDANLDFDANNTSSILSNLSKGMVSGRQCSLKACMRIRAAGHSCDDDEDPEGLGTGEVTIRGVYRFEAIVPDFSFQAVKITALPILTTPLSLTLTRCGNSNGNSKNLQLGGGCHMGYLTLNQTRKAVPLLETDPALSMAPIVGVWTTLNSGISNAGNSANSTRRYFVFITVYNLCNLILLIKYRRRYVAT